MAGTSLKIEDQYVEDMGSFFDEYGRNMEEAMESYLQIMNTIKEDSLMEGDTAEALAVFIEHGEFLKGKMEALGEMAKSVCANFLDEVDEKDQFLF